MDHDVRLVPEAVFADVWAMPVITGTKFEADNVSWTVFEFRNCLGTIQLPSISPSLALILDVGCRCRWPRELGFLQGRNHPQHSADSQHFQSENHGAPCPLNIHSSTTFKLPCFQSWHFLLVFSMAKRALTIC